MLSGYSYFAEHEDHIYRFIFSTKSGVKYAAYFFELSEYFGLTPLPPHLNAKGYNFGIARIIDDETQPFPFDPRIKYTVRDIVKDFFTTYQQEAILVINYDDSDGKQLKRFYYFGQWF